MALTDASPARASRLRERAGRVAAPLGVAAAVGAATLALHLRDPHQRGSWGFCPAALVGLDCPGCGGLRAVNDLTHLDLVSAASSNLLLVLSMPAICLAWVAWLRTAWRGRPPPRWSPSRPLMVLLVVGVVAFTVARNLPGSWLAA